ncbi:MAG: IS701 family transposase [Thermoplasmata archaeon]|nr:IS701 family transposase [Thermoplasmata archaeon]
MRRSSRARSGPTTDWFPDLDGWLRPFDPRFEVGARFRDTQRNARQYLAGLLLPGSRKSMDPIGNRIPEADGDRLQNFLTDSPWNAEEVQQQLAGQIAERFGVPHAVLALDDTTFPKQGSASVGVAHQWCGALGKTANCQSGVTLYYVLPFDRESREMVGFTVGARLYLPKKWIDDGPRRTKARVPPSVGYEDKPQIGLELIDRARAAGLPHRAVLADAEYGRSGEFRRALRERGESYVVGIQPHSTVVARAGEGPIRVDRLIPTVSAAEWRSVVWARGTKGPMTVELVRYPVTVWHEGKATEEEGILLLERRSNETKAYLAWGTGALSLTEMGRLMRSRWPIELGYRQMKQVLGLDHFEGRTWTGWHHHMTMVAMAQAFLASRKAERGGKGGPPPSVEQVAEEIHARVVRQILRQAEAATDPKVREERMNRLWALHDAPLVIRGGRITIADWRSQRQARPLRSERSDEPPK